MNLASWANDVNQPPFLFTEKENQRAKQKATDRQQIILGGRGKQSRSLLFISIWMVVDRLLHFLQAKSYLRYSLLGGSWSLDKVYCTTNM